MGLMVWVKRYGRLRGSTLDIFQHVLQRSSQRGNSFLSDLNRCSIFLDIGNQFTIVLTVSGERLNGKIEVTR